MVAWSIVPYTFLSWAQGGGVSKGTFSFFPWKLQYTFFQFSAIDMQRYFGKIFSLVQFCIEFVII